jgi:Protein of unknown function (DUF3048) N-terminal domain/Protein of unknown function (DUF3048) C-terminal domain
MREWLIAIGRKRAIAAVVVTFMVVAGGTVAVVAMAGGGSNAAVGAERQPSEPALSTTAAASTDSPTPAPTPIRFAGLLDGVPMSDDDWAQRKDLPPIAVMIDNSPDAFPHAGLDKADVIYEAFVEGGITRLMAVYWRQEAPFIEPVRSARTPFVIWADELGAVYAHAGEADTDNDANAAGQLSEWKIFDMNAFFGASEDAFYRDTERYSPHNLVTGTLALRAAAAIMGYAGPPTVQPWLFKRDTENTRADPDAHGIEVNFQAGRYPWQLVQYHWDAASKSYLRYQFGGPDIDAKTKEQLAFKNVVVMRVPSEVVDDVGHVLLDQFGIGPASVFLDGKQIEGTWKKADRKSRTRFYDAQGQEIAFDRGPTFVEVIGLQSSMTVTATVAELPAIPPYVPPPPAEPTSEDEGSTPTTTPLPAVSPSPTGSASPAASKTPASTIPTGVTPTGAGGSPSATPAPPTQASQPAASPTTH